MLVLRLVWRVYLKVRAEMKLIVFSIKWRRENRHNNTTITRIFPFSVVKVGSYTYGDLNVYSYSNGKDEELTIGNFVSIANEVRFILGGNHNIKSLSSFPLKTYVAGVIFEDSFSNGPINVEDEVWFGYGVTILSGVKIGKGAIIAAGTIVTKDVPAYSVFGGVPGRVIKYRFNTTVIEELLKFDLMKIPSEKIKNNIDVFYKEINSYEEFKNVIRIIS